MSSDDTPNDLVALFHCSFHLTKGNEIDWSLTSYPELSLDGVEFLTLPSGLHTIEEDVLYFTHQGHSGICVFRRRETSEEGLRGARLGALGVLVAKSSQSRPWRHAKALKTLSDLIDVMDNSRPPTMFKDHFESFKSSLPIIMDSVLSTRAHLAPRLSNTEDPLSSIDDLFTVFGPTSLTLLKYILSAKRIVIYTHPSAEAACRYAIAATDICAASISESSSFRESFVALGMVGLFDIERLVDLSKQGKGWIACTTDRLFLEKPQLYDLIIDLPTPPSSPSRPTLFASFPIPNPVRGSPTHRIRQIRPTFVDIRFWFDIQESLPSQPVGDPDSAHVIRDWQEALGVYMLRFWLAIQPNRRIHMAGDDPLHTYASVSTQSNHNDDNDEPPQSPTSAVLLLDRDISSPTPNDRSAQTHSIAQRYIAFLDDRASTFIPPIISPNPSSDLSSNTERDLSPVTLLPVDIGSFGLNPFSHGDVEFCRSFVTASIRRRLQSEASDAASATVEVSVSRPWREMFYWLIGWS